MGLLGFVLAKYSHKSKVYGHLSDSKNLIRILLLQSVKLSARTWFCLYICDTYSFLRGVKGCSSKVIGVCVENTSQVGNADTVYIMASIPISS
jgi:hypothetical protein